MRKVTLYQCEHCSYSTDNINECLEHEAEHYDLTSEQYQEWHELHESAARAGSIINITKNHETEHNFDKTVEKLVEFEKQHGLTDKHPPYHFY